MIHILTTMKRNVIISFPVGDRACLKSNDCGDVGLKKIKAAESEVFMRFTAVSMYAIELFGNGRERGLGWAMHGMCITCSDETRVECR